MLLFKGKSTDSTSLSGDTPNLDNAGKGNPFSVPESYFEQFENQILQQVRFVKPVTPLENFFRNAASAMLKPQVAVAASLVILIATSVLLYTADPQKDQSAKGFISDQAEPVILVSENLPDGKLYVAEIEETGNSKKITIYISPDFKPEHVQIISSIFPIPVSLRSAVEKNLQHYYAQNEQIADYEENVVKQTTNYKLTQNTPSHGGQSASYQTIYQYHPQYQSGSSVPLSSGSTSGANMKPIAVNADQQDSKTMIKGRNESKLPHFALPEYICSETPYELMPYSVSKNFRYQWSSGEDSPSIIVRSAGTYTLTIFDPDNNDEFVTSTSFVKIIPRPNRSVPSTAVLCSGGTLRIEPQIENSELYSYFWIPTYETTKDITVRNQGLYVLSITGCNTYYDSVLVTKDHCDVLFPNVITPNNDGMNDYFYIQGLDKYPGTRLVIYDRNGIQVFSTNDYQNNWSGDKLPSGTYFYIVRFYDGIEKHGTITILK